MKKIVCLVLAALMIALLAGCNYTVGVGQLEFKGIHCADFAGNSRDLTIVSWHNNDIGIEVKTEEAGSLFCSEGTYILFEDECPICGGGPR